MAHGTNRGKTALVTGASGGIGAELAKVFARGGYNLVLVARSSDKLAELKSAIEARSSVHVRIIPKDLADPASPEALYDQLQRDGINIDALVNNAGYAVFGPFVESNKNDELNMLQVNMITLTHLTKLFLPGMVERGHGRILNLGSTASFMPGPLMACYYASKAYVLSFSEALAEEVRGTGVTVTALCPGPTETDFQKRADMENSRLVSGRRKLSPAQVAVAGYRGAMKGEVLVIPGRQNKIVPFLVRLVPRSMVPAFVKRAQAPLTEG